MSAGIARQVQGLVADMRPGDQIELIDLREVDFTLNPDQYTSSAQSDQIREIQDEILDPSKGLIFVIPEYNGSFPGILKTFIDAISVRNYETAFSNKTALLIGVSTGRAGNLRGIDQMDHILQYLGMHTFPKKLPISQVHLYSENGAIVEENLLKDLSQTVHSYLEYSKYEAF